MITEIIIKEFNKFNSLDHTGLEIKNVYSNGYVNVKKYNQKLVGFLIKNDIKYTAKIT